MMFYIRPRVWKDYTFWTLCWDLWWFCFTGGLWLFYIPFRENRRYKALRYLAYPWIWR